MAKQERTVVKKAIDNGVVTAILYSDGTILVKDSIFSYPHVFKPYGGGKKDKASGNVSKDKFSLTMLIGKKTHPNAKNLIKEECDRLLKENKVERLKADLKFLRDGDLAEKDGYDGMYTVSASEIETKPPIVRGPNGQPITQVELSKLFKKSRGDGGCRGNGLIRPWFMDSTDWGKRLSANLVAVQFVKDGEPFGKGGISEEDIDETFGDESEASGEDEDLPDTDDL